MNPNFSDVFPVMGAVERDSLYSVIGFLQSFVKTSTAGGHSKDTAAVGEKSAVPVNGAGVLNRSAADLAVFVQALDFNTLGIGFWITAAGHNHTGSRLIGPLNIKFLQRAVNASL